MEICSHLSFVLQFGPLSVIIVSMLSPLIEAQLDLNDPENHLPDYHLKDIINISEFKGLSFLCSLE